MKRNTNDTPSLTKSSVQIVFFLILLALAVLATRWRFSPWMPDSFWGDDLSNFLSFQDGNFASSIDQALTQAASEKYRPVFALALYALFNLFSSKIECYLALNVFIQGFSGFLIFLLAYRLSNRNLWVGLAILFSVVTSRFALYQVTQVTGLVESIAWTFFLICLIATHKLVELKASQSASAWRCALAASFSAFLAIHTHERYILVAPCLALVFWFAPVVKDWKWQRYALVVLALFPALFNLGYKTLVIKESVLVGTAGTHIQFQWARVLTHIEQAIASIGGFNSGPSYLVGLVASDYNSSLMWSAAISISLLLLGMTGLGISKFVQFYKRGDIRIESTGLSSLSLLIAVTLALLIPVVMTIRLEQRWIFGPFSLALLITAWASGQTNGKLRIFMTCCIAILSCASICLDTALARNFDQIYMVYSNRVAQMVHRDITQVDPKNRSPIIFLMGSEHCSWTLLGGEYFRLYGSGKRVLECINPDDMAALMLAQKTSLSLDTKVYIIDPEEKMQDVTEEWHKQTLRAKENILFDFLASFQKGKINNQMIVDTPNKQGALLLNWPDRIGSQETLTVLPGFSYRFDGLNIPRNAELRLGVGMIYITKEPATAIIKIRQVGYETEDVVYRQVLPIPLKNGRLNNIEVSIPFYGFKTNIQSVSFAVEVTKNSNDAQWATFSKPRIVVPD